ncbi:cadherin-like domain-containing protein [Coraliomargarita parva]|uniref:cadherin-like domain-containing protein n=1 Tax=Coraliomargarita parva TaxID=3014050 RepID=UPI0022B558A7|nr:type I secretion C-terminal target domain-containing protein [Coraliomargarita parva]
MKAIFRFFPLVPLMLAMGLGTASANVPEPSTIFYGKVLHRAYGNEHRLTEGTLSWTLSNEAGTEYTYTAELEDLGGELSYRISIPHQALSSGLTVDSSVIPLGTGEAEYTFKSITVDGYPAAILWSEIDILKLLQNARAATHRIDLLVSFDLLDTDGDGMPDWWEQFYGLDWQTPDDELDPDDDGWNNLDEYYNGTNPFSDDRAPSVQTAEISAFGESLNGVWLRSADADTGAENLVYTLTSLPDGGYLLRIPAAGGVEMVLNVGDQFTQTELNAGVLAYRHTDTQVEDTSFGVSLEDGTYAADEAEVAIHIFPPSSTAVAEASESSAIPTWWRDENTVYEAYWGLRENVISGDLVESSLLYLLGKNYGWTIWDERACTRPVSLATTQQGSHFILGGSENDVLGGGDEGDILNGGEGSDILSGGAGVDLFIVSDTGLEVITDFSSLEDILDLSDLVSGQSGQLNAYLLASYDGADTTIGVDMNGDGSGYTDATIRLEGIELSQDDLHRLWSLGQLLLGSVQGYVSVTIEGWPTAAIEEGYSTADLSVVRNGPVSSALTVNLDISGSATNGVDYTSLPSSLSFSAGQGSIPLVVNPLLDGANEYTELVNLGLASGSNYVLGSVFSGQISIVDAKQRFSINAITDATVVGGEPAYLQIRRQGPSSGFVQLLLKIGGTGVSGTDFTAIPTIVSFADSQAALLLPVEALANGSLADPETSETVSVTIKPAFSEEYSLGTPTTATVRLLSDAQAFDAWLAESMPEVDSSLSESELATVSSPRTGFQALLEYALSYGLDLDDGVDAEERGRLVPQIFRESDGLHFEFTQRLNDENLQYIVECSPDLVNWYSGAEYFESVPLPAADANAGRVRYRVLSEGEEDNCFIRVRVELINQ